MLTPTTHHRPCSGRLQRRAPFSASRSAAPVARSVLGSGRPVRLPLRGAGTPAYALGFSVLRVLHKDLDGLPRASSAASPLVFKGEASDLKPQPLLCLFVPCSIHVNHAASTAEELLPRNFTEVHR